MKTTHLLFAIAIVPVLAASADAPFYSFNIDGPLGDARAQVSMKFEEIDRTETASIVRVLGITPGSSLSKGFMLDGMCGLAESRNQQYFQAKQIQSEPLILEVTFPKTALDSSSASPNFTAPNVFPVSQCPVFRLLPKRTVRRAQPPTQ